MGKGKGKIHLWAAKIKGGSTIFEIAGANKKVIINALKYCKFKLPIKTKIFSIFGFNIRKKLQAVRSNQKQFILFLCYFKQQNV